MELVIDRRIWLRGKGFEASKLLRREDQKRCCVGIYLQALGVPDKDMEDRSGATSMELPSEATWLVHRGWKSDIAGELYEANDRKGLSLEAREAKIAKLFGTQGVKVKFVN